jgi:cytosine/adenosine deaminase-related metal-dependent hydrolase
MIVGPCTIVTGGAEPRVLEDAAVRIVGGHIAQLGPAGPLGAAHPEETVWPARGALLMPGLVNAHAHLARHLARGLGLRGAADWERWDRALSSQDVHWSAVAALAEGVRHGVTTVCDFHRSGRCLDFSLHEIVDAAARVGVRVAACYGVADSDAAGDRRAAVDENVGFARRLARRREGRLDAVLGVRAGSLAGLERIVQESFDAAGATMPVHVDLGLDATPGERWRGGGSWPRGAPATLWAHADRAPRALVAAVSERGDALSATGLASVAALARETDLAWGSDAGLNAPPLPEPATPWPGIPEPAETHYRRVFVSGARWASRRFGERLGVIEAGAPADLVLVDYRPATDLDAGTLMAHLAAGLLRAPVRGVMVAGEIVLDQGSLVTIDENEIACRARESARRVRTRLGA